MWEIKLYEYLNYNIQVSRCECLRLIDVRNIWFAGIFLEYSRKEKLFRILFVVALHVLIRFLAIIAGIFCVQLRKVFRNSNLKICKSKNLNIIYLLSLPSLRHTATISFPMTTSSGDIVNSSCFTSMSKSMFPFLNWGKMYREYKLIHLTDWYFGI